MKLIVFVFSFVAGREGRSRGVRHGLIRARGSISVVNRICNYPYVQSNL